MGKGSYTYDVENIEGQGKDRMRFELGDTMVEGGPDTSALTDQEIQAAINANPESWKKAKLMLLESLCRRFAFEVDTKTGPLQLYMQERAKLWRADYDGLKKEVSAESCAAARLGGGVESQKPPYFYAGMHSKGKAGGRWGM